MTSPAGSFLKTRFQLRLPETGMWRWNYEKAVMSRISWVSNVSYVPPFATPECLLLVKADIRGIA